MKYLSWLIVVVVLISGIGVYMFWSASKNVPIKNSQASSPKDAAYSIEGQLVPLVNGTYATSTAPGSASQTIMQYFGNEAEGDLNGDGIPDTAFILTQSSGGSGTFYYVVAAIKSGDGYVGTNAILLGDRIAPQTTEIKNGMIVVNYADRKPNEPMMASPSMGVSKYVVFKNGSLVEAPAIATELQPFYSGVSWGPVEATTSPDYGVVAIIQSVPLTNLTDIAAKSTPYTSYYHDKLARAGWAQDAQREAGGPGAQTSVYTKGTEFIVVSFDTVFHAQPTNAPAQCPCDLQFTLMNGSVK